MRTVTQVPNSQIAIIQPDAPYETTDRRSPPENCSNRKGCSGNKHETGSVRSISPKRDLPVLAPLLMSHGEASGKTKIP